MKIDPETEISKIIDVNQTGWGLLVQKHCFFGGKFYNYVHMQTAGDGWSTDRLPDRRNKYECLCKKRTDG